MKIFRTNDSIISLENIQMVSPTYETRTRIIGGKKHYSTSIRLQYRDKNIDVDFVYSPFYTKVEECDTWIKTTLSMIELILIND